MSYVYKDLVANGEVLKREGQKRVAIHNRLFIFTMQRIAIRVAEASSGFFTIDDLRKVADEERLIPKHPNAWGALFLRDPVGYKFTNTGAYQQSRYASNNSRRIAVWAVTKKEVQS